VASTGASAVGRGLRIRPTQRKRNRPFVLLRNLGSGAGDDAESAAHPVAAEARHGIDVSVEKDEEEKTRVGRRARPPMLLQLVERSSDDSGRPGARSGYECSSARVLAGGASEANQQARIPPHVGAGVAPEFPPKQNYELIGNGGRTADDAASLEIGDMQVRGPDSQGARFAEPAELSLADSADVFCATVSLRTTGRRAS
jgi:hypothetical protein